MIRFYNSLTFFIILIFSKGILLSQISLGIDVLEQENFAPLKGKNIGLVINQASVSKILQDQL